MIDTQETVEVNDHDFGSAGSGTVIPHGVYDVGRNQGFVHLNTSHDTSELACDSKFKGPSRRTSSTHLLPMFAKCNEPRRKGKSRLTRSRKQ